MPKTIIHELSADNDPAAREQASAPYLGYQMALLSQMAEEISGELPLGSLLNRIAERACKLIGADDGVIGLYVPELDATHPAASYNIPRGHGLTAIQETPLFVDPGNWRC